MNLSLPLVYTRPTNICDLACTNCDGFIRSYSNFTVRVSADLPQCLFTTVEFGIGWRAVFKLIDFKLAERYTAK